LKVPKKLKSTTIIPVEKIIEEPYASTVCYPRTNQAEMQSRIQELKDLGVEALEFSGKAAAANVPVLGKGYVGVVVVAHVRGQRAALKMRRIDADRPDFKHESEMLQKANVIGIGPQFIAMSNNFLLSELIDGDLLEDWLEIHRDKGLIRKVLADVLEQCWRLDEAGLDHGEISKAPKHLLVDKENKPYIVDFETASIVRRVINVTSVCQFLFMGNSRAAKMLGEVFEVQEKSELISALRNFKNKENRENFEVLREFCLS
jgi:putative serine/threonine protein kinase